MRIYVFTIRNKITHELLYAEGTADGGEYCSFFELDGQYLTDEEKKWAGWRERGGGMYAYHEEVRHLFNYEYQHIKFSLEKVEIN